MEASGSNPASDLFQWEPNGNKRRSAGIHIDINSLKQWVRKFS